MINPSFQKIRDGTAEGLAPEPRRRDWLKVPVRQRDEFVVGGYLHQARSTSVP